MGRESAKPLPFPRKELFSNAGPRVFRSETAKSLAFPIGGIGTGTISLGARGELRDWEIFNGPAKDRKLHYSFFAIRLQEGAKKPIARILEAEQTPPYSTSTALSPDFLHTPGNLLGLPRLRSAKFEGKYPFARVRFIDEKLPVTVRLEAFNPFIPMNPKDSGIPAAIFIFNLKSKSRQAVEGTLSASLMNAVGFDGKETVNFSQWMECFGRNINEWRQEESIRGIKMTKKDLGPDSPVFGSMALATPYKDITWCLSWSGKKALPFFWHDARMFWLRFLEEGKFSDGKEPIVSGEKETLIGSLGLKFRLQPGEEVSLPAIITWHFPTRLNEWNSEPQCRGKRLVNFYATLWKDAWEVARYVAGNLSRLKSETLAFENAFFKSTLPGYILEAVSSQISTIRTNTCLRLEDGSFFGFEGCGDGLGCCPMNCTHVWNYEQTLAHLFPDLERSMRRTDFLVNTREDGHMAFRTLLPLGSGLWQFKPAADGQMGCILKLYREWQQSGDDDFLKELWPKAKKALEFAWRQWDADRDGLMEGEQHNTYDIEFYGPNPFTGILYLGALRAAEEMARFLGDEESARTYRQIFEKGRKKIEKELWNGDYFEQRIPAGLPDTNQIGKGCLSDQLLGQWFCNVVGLGYLIEPRKIRRTLSSIFKYNWMQDLSNHLNTARVYALGEEKGLLVSSWPKGGRPVRPFPYADEVWTGTEYAFAALLIQEGFLLEGLSIIKAIRERHDGVKRNPWNEPECGDHYARAMSSWSVLLALEGYHYSAVEKSFTLKPRIRPENFRAFFSAGSAWGRFSQKFKIDRQQAALEIFYGNLQLQSLKLSNLFGKRAGLEVEVKVLPENSPVEAITQITKEQFDITFAKPLLLRAGQTARVAVRLPRRKVPPAPR